MKVNNTSLFELLLMYLKSIVLFFCKINIYGWILVQKYSLDFIVPRKKKNII